MRTRITLPVLAVIGLFASLQVPQVTDARRIPRDPRTPISSLPFTVDECGSYFLTGCLTGVGGQNGITVDADDVTIDLNGFSLTGAPGSLAGIAGAGRARVTVRDGAVTGWGGNGIALGAESIVRGVRATDNDGLFAIEVGANSLVLDCTASSNGDVVPSGIGFGAGAGSIVRSCVSASNLLSGFQVMDACLVTGSAARFNGVHGIAASLDRGVLLMGNTCVQNSGQGINLGDEGLATGNTCALNGDRGIIAGAGGYVFENVATGNFLGFETSGLTTVTRNEARANTFNYAAGGDLGPVGMAATATSAWANISD